MKIMIFLLLLISSNVYAFDSCTMLIQKHKYLLKSGVEYCLESEYRFVYLKNSEFSSNLVEISNVDNSFFELVYPGEQLPIPDKFKITTLNDMHLSVINGFIYLEDPAKVRKRRSLIAVGKAIGSSVSGAVGSSLVGGDLNLAPTIVGTAIGTVVGLATGPLSPVTGPLIAGMITQDIISNQNKPRPPLTIINTNIGLNHGRGTLSGGRIGGNCRSCHDS
ncbi:hypothetical protein [Photobacterium carnosum]|uniref:hypothetical protein n=1 Tax=Photobacterium carnosum TaxID=2023717 RepID=UPI001E35C393|nr:hypothetical protein [Photobacterium carnosum]MCD9496862.1 hypothetical protein [Photobacterium carnosum]